MGPPPGMGGPGAGHSAPGGGPPGMAGPGAASAPSGPGGGLVELLQYLPENLRIAAGASFATLNDKSHPVGPRLLTQFQPVVGIVERGGIKPEQIDLVWTGNNRETGDLVICVRTKSNIDAAAVAKGLGAVADGEKIGKASVHNLPTNPAYKNAVAFVDAKTLLVGRYDTVAAALRNPKPGAVRYGFDALNLSEPYYWIAGDDAHAHVWLNARGVDVLESLFATAVTTRGVAVAFGGSPVKEGAPAGPGGPGAPGGAGMGMGMMGPPPGLGPPPPMGPTGGMMMGGPNQNAAAGKDDVPLAVGLSFASEALASTIESRINDLVKAAQQANNPQGGYPGMPPGYPPPAGAGPPGFQGAVPPGTGPTPGPGGAPPPGGMSMPNMANPGGANRPGVVQRVITVARNKENLRLSMSLPPKGVPFVTKFINDAIQATGASAIADGIFDGTLTLLAAGTQQWPAAKPETLHGVRRIGDMPIRAGYSWMTDLLPFVGHHDLYTLFDLKKTWADPSNLPHTMTSVPAFLNPADPRSNWDGYPFDGLALTHFVGMSGVEDGRNVVAAELPRTDPRAGIFGYDEVAKFSDVTDGTSQTIMVIGSGEELVAPWVQGGGATIRGARAPYFDKYTGLGSRGLAKPGAFVMFADGSARTISADIDPAVFKAMCTMHGAEQIDMSKLATKGQD